MSIKYVVRSKSNPRDGKLPKKWYAMTKSDGDAGLRSMGKRITQRCTVNQADTLAVLEALTQILCEDLDDGKISRLGDFGSFQVTLGSTGAESEEKFHPSMITGGRVVFRPGVGLKEMLNNLTYEKYSK